MHLPVRLSECGHNTLCLYSGYVRTTLLGVLCMTSYFKGLKQLLFLRAFHTGPML